MGDRVAILNQGALQQFGKASNIYFHPVNVFVAGFIGTPPTNFFDCNLIREETYVFDAGPFKYPVPEPMREKAKEWPSSLVLGVRPQDVRVHAKAASVRQSAGKGQAPSDEKLGEFSASSFPLQPLINATLEIDEPLGDRQVLDLRVGDYLVRALVLPDFKAELGDELWIDFPGDKIYVFDKKTGQALL